MAEPVVTAIIGYGMASRVFHAPIISTLNSMNLYGFVERHAEESRKKYPTTKLFRDTEKMLANQEIELVVITTPNESHFPLAIQALEAGKHVVVEKPFTPTYAQAQQLIELAEERDRVLSVFQNRRWDGDFLTVKNLLHDKTLGRLVEFESHFDRFRNRPKEDAWREKDLPGSGILYDLGSHLIDQALVLFGQPEMITADVRRQRDFGESDDFFEIILHYGQLRVVLKASMLVKEYGPRFILHGTEGAYVKYSLDPQEKALKSGEVPSDESWGREPKEQWGTLYMDVDGDTKKQKIETATGCYQKYYQNIADVIRGNGELMVKPEQARNTIRIIEKAFLSSRESRSVKYLISED